MKRSRLSYDEWKSITSKSLRGEKISSEFLTGYIGLLEIHAVEEPQIWRFNGEDIVVCDRGIKWLTILPGDDFYCITCMLNEQEEILLWYIDMIAGQGIDRDGIPYFDDLYLDLVVYPDGTIVEDDMDELVEALKQKDITEEQYQLALRTAERLRMSLLHDVPSFINFTGACLELLK